MKRKNINIFRNYLLNYLSYEIWEFPGKHFACPAIHEDSLELQQG